MIINHKTVWQRQTVNGLSVLVAVEVNTLIIMKAFVNGRNIHIKADKK